MEDPTDILKNGKWSWQVDVPKGMVYLYLHVPMYKPDFVFDLYRYKKKYLGQDTTSKKYTVIIGLSFVC